MNFLLDIRSKGLDNKKVKSKGLSDNRVLIKYDQFDYYKSFLLL